MSASSDLNVFTSSTSQPFILLPNKNLKSMSHKTIKAIKRDKLCTNNFTLQHCNESSVSLHSLNFGTFLWAIHKKKKWNFNKKKDFNPYIFQSLDSSMCYCMIHSGLSMNFFLTFLIPMSFRTGWEILNWHCRINWAHQTCVGLFFIFSCLTWGVELLRG